VTTAAALPAAFFLRDGADFVGTAATAGPWDPGHMHFGPPAALLARAIDALPGEPSKRIARVTFEILRPVPVGRVGVTARAVRSGGRIELAEAVLTDADGTDLALCRAWRIRVADIAVPAAATAGGAPPPPDRGAPEAFFPVDVDVHYGAAMEARFLRGAFTEPGPADVWMRMRIPLVAEEPTAPLSRVLVAADSGNGVSAAADPRDLLFVNTDLTVHLHRHPVGEWVLLRSSSVIDAGGSGLATSQLADEAGPIGTSLQTLFVAER
jgi:hypothetical protein